MLLGFKERFVTPITSGRKDQTIRLERADRKRPTVGETLYLYTGLRTKHCRRIGIATCSDVEGIEIINDGMRLVICIGGDRTTDREALSIIKRDGFDTPLDFFETFRKMHSLPFRGFVVRWTNFTTKATA